MARGLPTVRRGGPTDRNGERLAWRLTDAEVRRRDRGDGLALPSTYSLKVYGQTGRRAAQCVIFSLCLPEQDFEGTVTTI